MPIASSSISSPQTDGKPVEAIDEPPPFLGSWRNVYLLVAIELVVLVFLFWLLMRWAS